MKKYATLFAVFLTIITAFTTICIFLTEKTDALGISKLNPSVEFHEKNGTMTLSWKKIPYPCFYTVETLCPTTGLVENEPRTRLIERKLLLDNTCELKTTAVPMIYKITAYGIFGKLDGPFIPLSHPYYKEPLSPVMITHYPKEHKASVMPFLVWHAVPQAVCYEVEILSAPPENEYGTELSKKSRLVSTSRIYTNGWQADLRDYANEPKLFWRVRALDLERRPIGVFSKAEPLVIDKGLPIPDYPLINNFDKMPDEHLLLYPAYNWIPMHNVTSYEVELLSAKPAKEHNTEPTPDPVWRKVSTDTFSCYDEMPRPKTGKYFWRVRAIDESGATVGRYSDTAEFNVSDRLSRVYAASFGDSITHGGGAVSYSPASREYDYISYLDFDAINLGRSGDTTDTSLGRFESDVLPFKPLNLLIMTGANDLRAYRPVDEMIADLESIKQKCITNDIRPIFLTLLPINPMNINLAFGMPTNPLWHSRLRAVNDYIRKQEYYIDLEPYFYDISKTVLDTHFAVDGLHPDVRGKMLIAEIINANKDKLRK